MKKTTKKADATEKKAEKKAAPKAEKAEKVEKAEKADKADSKAEPAEKVDHPLSTLLSLTMSSTDRFSGGQAQDNDQEEGGLRRQVMASWPPCSLTLV